MIVETVVVGDFETNCYVVVCERTRRAIVVDPGADPDRIREAVRSLGAAPELIVNTHGHMDHICADDAFDLPVAIHEDDAAALTDAEINLSRYFAEPCVCPAPSRLLTEGDVIEVGDIRFTVIHTPGHTPGGICLYGGGVLIAGDTLFADGVGRTDFPGGSEETLLRSIREKLLVLPDETIVHPGHGPETTIGRERPSF